MFKFLLAMILFIFIICMILEFFVFLFDVKKWHDAEERINIVPSAVEASEHKESEVSGNESDDRQHDSSTISFSWRES